MLPQEWSNATSSLFLQSLRLIELKAIGLLSKVKHFAENDLIYSSGDEGDQLYIITRGAVELVPQNARPGSPTTYLSRGRYFRRDVHADEYQAQSYCASLRGCERAMFPSQRFSRARSAGAFFFFYLSEKLANRLFQARELTHSPNNSLELTGSLINFDIVTIYQTIIQSMQTGLLTIADEAGETISTFYFEKGTPRWGRFEHLSGEEAFWQLFLHDHRSGTFSFSNETKVGANWGEGSAMTRNAGRNFDQRDSYARSI